MRNSRAVLLTATATLAVALLWPAPARATMEYQKAAKAAGFTEASSCTYCHVEKIPKKGAATENERGKWLKAEKEKRKAEKIDVTWLKDYQPAK